MPKLAASQVFETLTSPARHVADKVELELAPGDGMYEVGGDDHYLMCGASALNIIMAAQQLAVVAAPAAVLDFGGGAGRVTRWLRAAFPEASLDVCDLRAADMDFCRKTLQAKTWISGTDIDALAAPGRYDLIWVGSVLTHLSASQTARLIDKLLSWTNPGGLLVMSTIGRTARARRDQGDSAFIDQQGWEQITKDYTASGYGYADYPDQQGYGLSLTKLSWIGALVEAMPSTRLVMLAEGVWDTLHDVIAIQAIPTKTSDSVAQPSAAGAVAKMHDEARRLQRSDAIERSTIWKATGPIRSLSRWLGR